jgi:hypothetical protein
MEIRARIIDLGLEKYYNLKVVFGSILIVQQEMGHPPAWCCFFNSFIDKYL